MKALQAATKPQERSPCAAAVRRRRPPGVEVPEGRPLDSDAMRCRKPRTALSQRGAKWKQTQYADVQTMWRRGARAEDISKALYLGLRKVRETVAALNRDAGTERRCARVCARRVDTAVAWQLTSVKGKKARRAMNMRELNAHVVEKREWKGTAYATTRRDAIAMGLRGCVARVERSGLLRGARLGRGASKLRAKVGALVARARSVNGRT